MNAYSLTFKDNTLENQYMTQELQLKWKVLLIIAICGLVICLIDIVTNSIKYFEKESIISSIILSVYFLCLIILLNFFKQKTFIYLSLFITNMLLSTVGIDLDENYNAYNGFLLGSNQMLVHQILIYVSCYRIAVLSNIFLCVIRLVIISFSTEYLTAEQFVYTIGASLFYLVINYSFEKNKRNLFLANFKDKVKDVMFPSIVGKPYFIFQLNQDNMQLETKYQTPHQILDQFICQSNFKAQILKKKIFDLIQDDLRQRNKQKEQETKLRLEVILNNKKIRITFFIFRFEQLFYAITIDSDDESVQLIEESYFQRLKNIRHQLHLMLISMGKLSNIIIKKKSTILAVRMRLSQIQITIMTEKRIVLEDISLTHILKSMIKFLQNFKINIKLIQQGEVRIKTIQNLLVVFLLEILKYVISTRCIIQLVQNQESYLIVKFKGLTIIPQSPLYFQLYSVFVQKCMIEDDEVQYYFNDCPHYSYMHQ